MSEDRKRKSRKSNLERQREVERQLEAMRVAIGDDNWSDSESDSDDSEALQERGHGTAMESARKFLWDEVDDEDDHLYLAGRFPTKPVVPPRRASLNASARGNAARASSGANMFRPTAWDSQRWDHSQRSQLDDSINLMDASDRESLGPNPSVSSTLSILMGGKRKHSSTSTPWYDADGRDADDYLDRRVKKRSKWTYLAILCHLTLWGILLGVLYTLGSHMYDYYKETHPGEPEPIEPSDLEKHAHAVQKALVKNGVLLESALEDPDSYQAAALKWLVKDSMQTQTKAKDPFMIQRYTLALFYLSTHGDEWTQNDGWMTNEGYCSWHGISCLGTEEDMAHRHGNGRVFELNLASNQVRGNLPLELNGLTDLFFLELQDNKLDGTIPENLGNWTGLRMFSIAHNDLFGSIPVSLVTTSPDLHVLNAGHNGLTGTIPPEIGDARRLREIRLEFNGLYGHLPNSLRKLDRLETLHLAGNKLGGSLPDGIYDLARLETLYLHDNSLTGRLSNNFARLTHLELLTLNQNQMIGTIPNAFSNIKFLQQIQLHANEFSGTIPESICHLKEFNKLTYISATCAKSAEAKALGVHCECCTACK